MLENFINSIYLTNEKATILRNSALAKPVCNYVVIDDFFRPEVMEGFKEQHQTLEFSESIDQTMRGQNLPYDSAVVFANDSHYGSELFFDYEWHQYCAWLVNVDIDQPTKTEIKLRYHRPEANGFWIHTDSVVPHRDIVVICYFNDNWDVSDGGLLQLWKPIEPFVLTPSYDDPEGRLDFLNTKRIRTRSPGGGFKDRKEHDLVLIDQVVPESNRVFICNSTRT